MAHHSAMNSNMLASVGAFALIIGALMLASYLGRNVEKALTKATGNIVAPQWLQIASIGLTACIALGLFFLLYP